MVPFPACTAPRAGAAGIIPGTTDAEPEAAVVVPTALVAETMNVYESPLVNPVMVHEVPSAVHVKPEVGLEGLVRSVDVAV